jgi:tRNA(Ile)-lysidine synthase
LEALLNRIVRTIERHTMFVPGQRVGVAVSGGADSVCLLAALHELAPRWGLALTVLHLDHGLRGEESAADAEFVARLATELGLAAIVERVDLRSEPGNLEQNARRARLDFFRRQIASGTVDRVALGHTRSDQAETVLFRFLRGAAGPGLAGIRPVTTSGIVRPLLEIDRAEVEDFLRARGALWREDSTNRDPAFSRNRIRHSLLPQLAREWNPGIQRALAQTAEWALAEEAWWEAEIDRLTPSLLTEGDGAILISADRLSIVPLAAARRLVRRAVERVKGDLRGLDFSHIAAVLELATAEKGHGHARAPGLDVLRSFDWLRLSAAGAPHRPASYSLPLAIPQTVEIPGSGSAICMELIDRAETPEGCSYVYNREMDCVDWPRVSGPLELRNWRPGDRYQPIGHTGEEKVKNLFQKARIPIWERSSWPVLADRSGIVWTRRFGTAARLSPEADGGMLLRIREIVKLESGTPAKASIKI